MIAHMTTIGVPTEVKTDEYRVALTPAGVRELAARGHEVLVQAGAGAGLGDPGRARTPSRARTSSTTSGTTPS